MSVARSGSQVLFAVVALALALAACREPAPLAPAPIVAIPVAAADGGSAIVADDPPKKRRAPRQGFRPGEAVDVEWRGSWYPAEVLELVPPESYRIHYDGYDASWDEDVGTDRMRKR